MAQDGVWQTQAAVMGTVNCNGNTVEWIPESAIHTARWLSFTSLSFSKEINSFQENAYFQQITSVFLRRPELATISWDYLELLTKNEVNKNRFQVKK